MADGVVQLEGVPIGTTDNGDDTRRLNVDAKIDVGDIEIGAVELKDGATDTRAKVGAGSGIVTGDNAVAVRDATAQAAGENHLGAVGGNSKVVEVTPTLTVHASYVAGDYVGTSGVAMVFANMGRVAGGTLTLMPARLLDAALQSIALELWLFDTAVTPPNDSAAWTITDADAVHCVAVLPFSTYFASAANSVAFSSNAPILVKCAAADTNLYGCLVTRGAPTYASGDLVVALRAYQD